MASPGFEPDTPKAGTRASIAAACCFLSGESKSSQFSDLAMSGDSFEWGGGAVERSHVHYYTSDNAQDSLPPQRIFWPKMS